MKKILLTLSLIIIFTLIGTIALATTGIVTTDDLNVREEANTNAKKLGTIEKNDEINIIEELDDWYKIQYKNGIGYVSQNYVKIQNAIVNNTIESEEEEKQEQEQEEEISENIEEDEETNVISTNKTTFNLEKNTTLYILPLVSSLKINDLSEGTEVTVISDNGKWLYVQTDKESGWITSTLHTSLKQTSSNTNNEKEEEEKTVNEVEENKVEESTVQETKNETSNTVASEESNENKSDDTKYPITMYVSVDSANIRKSPSATAEVISGTAKNASMKVIAKEGEWYKVDTEDGIGYIRSDLVSEKKN